LAFVPDVRWKLLRPAALVISEKVTPVAANDEGPGLLSVGGSASCPLAAKAIVKKRTREMI
jgi:hypothetical protein